MTTVSATSISQEESEDILASRYFLFGNKTPVKFNSPVKSPTKHVRSNLDETPGTFASPVKVEPIPMKQECERCGKSVSLVDYVTHMDYHLAKDLSREINGLPPLSFDLRSETLERLEREKQKGSSSSPTKKSGKRLRGSSSSTTVSKRGRPASKVSSSIQSVKTLDSYFERKT